MSIKTTEKVAWGVLLLSLVGACILTVQIHEYETRINEMIEITDQMDRTVRQFEVWANQYQQPPGEYYRIPPEEFDQYSFPDPYEQPTPNNTNKIYNFQGI